MLRIGTQICGRIILPKFVKPTIGNVTSKENLISLNLQFVRNTSFFNRLKQEDLWRGVISVSNAGKRRGRGRLGDRRGKRNLNEGQKIGDGKIGVLWPGLNYSILGKDGISEIKKLPENVTRTSTAPVSTSKTMRSGQVNPLERGWSGRQIKGKCIGPPDSVQDETFEGFQSIVLDHKMKTMMTAVMGRKRKFLSIVATGNSNGVIGVGTAQGLESKSCVNLAKNRASKRLITIDLIDKNRINHDFFSEYGRTRITVLKKPEGYGLRCHRVIAALCKLIGIENMYAKVEGASSNTRHVIAAFIIGLRRQKTYQEIADEKKLHLVEFKEETYNFPVVLASPQECLTLAEARKDPTQFREYIMGGRVLYDKGPNVPFYKKLPAWSIHLKRTLFYRNHDKVKIELLTKYGAYCSHLTEKYPECRRNKHEIINNNC